MEKSLIKQRIMELSQKDHLDGKSNKILFEQYNIDKVNGVRPKDSEVRTLLIMGNEKLIYLVMTKRFGISNPQPEMEQYAAGMLGLVKAVDTYDISKGVSFSSYAISVIGNQIGMEYRKINKRHIIENVSVSLEDYVTSANAHNNLKFSSVIGECDTFIEQIQEDEIVNIIYRSMKYLTQQERDCLIYAFGLFGNQTLLYSDIAKKLGINRVTVGKIIKRTIKKLRIMVQTDDMLTQEELILKENLLKANGPILQK